VSVCCGEKSIATRGDFCIDFWCVIVYAVGGVLVGVSKTTDVNLFTARDVEVMDGSSPMGEYPCRECCIVGQ